MLDKNQKREESDYKQNRDCSILSHMTCDLWLVRVVILEYSWNYFKINISTILYISMFLFVKFG